MDQQKFDSLHQLIQTSTRHLQLGLLLDFNSLPGPKRGRVRSFIRILFYVSNWWHFRKNSLDQLYVGYCPDKVSKFFITFKP